MSQERASGTITVLFTDLVSSTDLMSRLGAERFDTVRQAHFGALRGAIGRHRGKEIKNTGDGLMATFGSMVDALRCAISMQQATDRQARTGPAPIAIRVGVSIGEVTFEDGDIFGVPVIEAARLVAAAGPGKIVTTTIARALAGGRGELDFVDLGSLQLKGLPDPVPACEVVWQPTAASLPMPALLTDIGRVFVGRNGEVERLAQLWKEAAAGERRVALLAGEPGVGKTRLAAELAGAAHSEGAVVLAGRCDEDLGVPYQPFVEALRHFVDHSAPQGLEGHLGRYGGELVRLVPELADRIPGLAPPLRSDPETERYRLFDAVAAWLAATAAEQPVVLVLDDLQWAAKPTLLLLRHIVRYPELRRVVILGTYRDTELTHDHPLVEVLADLRRQGGVERLSLAGLDTAAVEAYLEQAAGHALDDSDLALAGAIHRETEGNPFFVAEVLRHLAETGGIEQRHGRWGARLPVEELGIPEGAREVVGQRLSRLSAEANGVLRVAAVIGTEFEVPVLQLTASLDEDSLLTVLEEATEARLVVETATPTARYRFAHALVRDSIYGDLSSARRGALHRKVAEAIEATHGGALDDHLPSLTHHWSRAAAPAADTSKAVDYAARAGHRALAQLAHDEAVAYYRQGLDLLDAAGTPSDDARRLDLLIALGDAERCAGDPAFRRTLRDATHLAQSCHDADALARAVLAGNRGVMMSLIGSVDDERVAIVQAALDAQPSDDSPVRARLLAALGLELAEDPDRPRRLRLCDEALAMARRIGDPLTLSHVLAARYQATHAPDTLPERLGHADELVSIAAGVADPARMAWSRFLRCRTKMEAGDVDGAERDLQAMERIAAELGQPTLRWCATWVRAATTLFAGRIAEGENLVHRAAELAEASGQPDRKMFFAGQLFIVRFEQGRLHEVRDNMHHLATTNPQFTTLAALLAVVHIDLGEVDDARRTFESFGASDFAGVRLDTFWLLSICELSYVASRLGDQPRAAILYRLLAPHADLIAGVTTLWIGSVAHYLAMLAATLEDWDEAESRFVAAAAFHHRIGAPGWLARTRLEWARTLLARRQPGDVDRARHLLGQALDTARDLGLGNVERRVVGLLGERG